MTLKKAKELITESEKTGRPIQYRYHSGGDWLNADPGHIIVGNAGTNYRVAPPEPPKPREIWRRSSEVGYDFADEEQRKHLIAAGYVLFREVLPEVKS